MWPSVTPGPMPRDESGSPAGNWSEGFADHTGPRLGTGAPAPSRHHWFEGLADHMGPAYLRYSFTRGTTQEVDFLVEHLGLGPGSRVLDVGCGPGRHSLEMARRGIDVVGVDIAQTFVDLADQRARAEGLDARFHRMDARDLTADDRLERRFDVVLSLCQGAFGLQGGPDPDQGDLGEKAGTAIEPDVDVLTAMAVVLRGGGRLVLSAFSAPFMVRHWPDADFDVNTGVNHETTEIRDPQGNPVPAELWTTCFTPRELRLAALLAGLVDPVVYSVEPGDYSARPPNPDTAEFLLVARKPL